MNSSLIVDLMDELKKHLNKESILIKEIIRSEQAGDRPEYPYASYKITTKENLNYNNRTEIENPDNTKYSEKFLRKEKLIVSFVLVGENLFDLYGLADKCYDFLNVISYDYQRKNNFKIEILNQVQDRSIFLETDYENRVGFDFEIRGTGELIRTMDAVDLNATAQNVQLEILD